MTLQDLIEELQRLPKSALTATVLTTVNVSYGHVVQREASSVRYESGQVYIKT